jgi:hypothetical protein
MRVLFIAALNPKDRTIQEPQALFVSIRRVRRPGALDNRRSDATPRLLRALDVRR